MSDYPMLISNKLHSFRNFTVQSYKVFNFPPITILCYSLYLNCGIFVRLCNAKVAKS